MYLFDAGHTARRVPRLLSPGFAENKRFALKLKGLEMPTQSRSKVRSPFSPYLVAPSASGLIRVGRFPRVNRVNLGLSFARPVSEIFTRPGGELFQLPPQFLRLDWSERGNKPPTLRANHSALAWRGGFIDKPSARSISLPSNADAVHDALTLKKRSGVASPPAVRQL
jgi:hypothetical protein